MNSPRIRGLNAAYGDWQTPESEPSLCREQYDFRVERHALYYGKCSVGIGESAYGDVPQRQALVRQDDGVAVGVVSEHYTPVLHGAVIDALDAAFPDTLRRVGVTDGGARMLYQYRFPGTSIEIQKNDVVEMTLLGGNSFDTTQCLALMLGAWRLICSNGMKIGVTLGEVAVKHRGMIDLDVLVARMADAKRIFGESGELWRDMASINLFNREAWLALGLNLTREKQGELPEELKPVPAFKNRETVYTRWLALKDSERTAWGFYNAITHVGSHSAVGLKGANDMIDFAGRATRYACEKSGRPLLNA